MAQPLRDKPLPLASAAEIFGLLPCSACAIGGFDCRIFSARYSRKKNETSGAMHPLSNLNYPHSDDRDINAVD
jgi:hypothetical protein